MLALLALALVAQSTSSPAPMPTATPVPVISVMPEFTLYHFWTSGAARPAADVANGLLNVTINADKLHANATVGDYGFPTVGSLLLPDNAPGANVQLHSPLPIAAVAYNFNSRVSCAAGKFAALLGQESPFTYQMSTCSAAWLGRWIPRSAAACRSHITTGPGPRRCSKCNDKRGQQSGVRSHVHADDLQTSVAAIFLMGPFTRIVRFGLFELRERLGGRPHWYVDVQSSVVARISLWEARNGSSPSDRSPNADIVGFGPGSRTDSQTITRPIILETAACRDSSIRTFPRPVSTKAVTTWNSE